MRIDTATVGTFFNLRLLSPAITLNDNSVMCVTLIILLTLLKIFKLINVFSLNVIVFHRNHCFVCSVNNIQFGYSTVLMVLKVQCLS